MTDKDAVLAANAAYYRAFSTADFAAMTDIWAPDDVSCIHPGWPALIGRRAVLESYYAILSNPHQERIAHQDEVVMTFGAEARVLCVEVVAGVRLAATNWFRRIDDVWRMIHHQATAIGSLAEEATDAPPGRRLN
jgi:ketosteroid isomerase-like protein